MLAHLRRGHTYAQLAAGFGVGTTTTYRYIAEAVDILDDTPVEEPDSPSDAVYDAAAIPRKAATGIRSGHSHFHIIASSWAWWFRLGAGGVASFRGLIAGRDEGDADLWFEVTGACLQ